MERKSPKTGSWLKTKRRRNRRTKKKNSQPRNQSKVISLTENSSKSREIIALKPAQYSYPAFIIQLAIQQRIISFTSWRGLEKNFKLWAQFFNLPTPNFLTIRQWFLKLGLFELRKKKEKRKDWIFIIDTIFEQGQKKCFLVLGLSYQKWTEKLPSDQKNLQHHDLEVLAIEVIDKTNGEIIESLISNLAKIVGQPLQIISDHGSDLKKGIELFIAKNPRTIYTYDFTHQVALYLKHELSNNQKFREFVHQCTVTRSQIQQTELSFLTPPAQRSKARYHNLDILINWGLKLLIYWKKQDFSLISNQFIIDRETLFILSEELDPNSLGKLAQILGTKASSCTSFEQIITETIGRELYQEKGQIILAAAAVGRRRFLAKFGWLFNYEAAIHIYAEILKVFDLAKKQFIQQGIHQDSQQDWLKATEDFPRSPWVQKAQQKVSEYLAIEGEKLPVNQTFLATSDIIESIFGKYKIFASSSSNSEINEMILTLSLSTTKLTLDKVIEAMETIQLSELTAWSKEVFGQSMISKRKAAFSVSRTA